MLLKGKYLSLNLLTILVFLVTGSRFISFISEFNDLLISLLIVVRDFLFEEKLALLVNNL